MARLALVTGTSTGIGRANGLPPEAVAEVVGKALTARRPRTRYLVGRDAKSQALLARLLPDRAYDPIVARVLASGAGK